MHLLIDGDMVAFEAASVGDGHKWIAPDGYKERYKEDIVKYCKANDLPLEFTEEYVPDPIQNVLHTLKLILENAIFEAFPSVSKVDIFLTGKNNFRNEVATIKKYKGNRDGLHRPFHLDACKQYLVDQWCAVVADGEEADDAMGYSQTDKTCVCSNDKDLDMIPGAHFNWNRQERYHVGELDAMRYFYCQLLTGDGTDNILGLYGVGKKSSLLKDIWNLLTEKEMFQYVRKAYEDRFGSYWKQFLLENAQLLWIRRKPGQMWEIPHEVQDETAS